MKCDWNEFTRRFRELCEEYCDIEHPEPPCDGIPTSRFNALISGKSKPTPEERIPSNEGQVQHEGVTLMAVHHPAGEGDRIHFWDDLENKQNAFSLWEAHAL